MTIRDRIKTRDTARLSAPNIEVGRSASTAASAPRAGKARQRHDVRQSADRVTLSDEACALAAAHTAVQNACDVRQQKVTEIKQQLSAGTYHVFARVLARKMLDVPTCS